MIKKRPDNMDFAAIKTEIKNIELDTMRADNDDYLEVVFKRGSMDKVISSLENLLGKAVWPSKERLSKDAQRIADNFGGLRKGQTLFFASREGVCVFAMLWPWQDGERITLKMGKA